METFRQLGVRLLAVNDDVDGSRDDDFTPSHHILSFSFLIWLCFILLFTAYTKLEVAANPTHFLSSQNRYNGIFCSHARATDIFACSSVGRGSFKSIIVSPLLINAFT